MPPDDQVSSLSLASKGARIVICVATLTILSMFRSGPLWAQDAANCQISDLTRVKLKNLESDAYGILDALAKAVCTISLKKDFPLILPTRVPNPAEARFAAAFNAVMVSPNAFVPACAAASGPLITRVLPRDSR